MPPRQKKTVKPVIVTDPEEKKKGWIYYLDSVCTVNAFRDSVSTIMSETFRDFLPSISLKNFAHFIPEGDAIKSVSNGNGFSIILTELGGVYVIGQNCTGNLGMGDYKDYSNFTINTVIEKEMKMNKDKCVQVACGNSHTIFLTEKGFVYGCGSAVNGVLGVKSSRRKQGKPKRIKAFDNFEEGERLIEKVACGAQYSLFLTRNYKLFVCGSNTEGQLGLKDDSVRIVNEPVKNIFFDEDNDRIQCIGTSTKYCVYGTVHEYLHVFGSGGFDHFRDYSSRMIPNAINYSFFYKGIRSIACGSGFCFVMDASNVWYLVKHKVTPLDEYIRRNSPPELDQFVNEFIREGDSCVSVVVYQDCAIILTRRRKVLRWMYSLSELTLENFSQVGEEDGSQLRVGMLRAFSYLIPFVYKCSKSGDEERLGSDHRRMLRNLAGMVEHCVEECAGGKRGQGVVSTIPFSDVTVVRSDSFQPIKKIKQ